MSTTTGIRPMIVIDDPHGFVVPDPDVLIVGRRSLIGHLLPVAGFAHVSDAQIIADVNREAIRQGVPELRLGKKTGFKKRLKGLRP